MPVKIDIRFVNIEALAKETGTMPGKLDEALYDKINMLTDVLYEKVIENLSGKVLQTKTGKLRGSIRHDIRRRGNTIIGEVAPRPIDAKAAVHELGGTKSYEILPIKARMLHFLGKDGSEVYTRRVWHPPLAQRSYLQSALDEMPGQIYEAFLAAVDEALSV